MYRRDAEFGKDSSVVSRTLDYNLPVKKYRNGNFKITSAEIIYVCMTSDFFLEEADEWRKDIWSMIKIRNDLHFYIITKRIERFFISLPEDWNDGYANVTICSTCENKATAEYRIPILLSLPIKHREIIHEPMLEDIPIESFLQTGLIERVICGGESGPESRICEYSWILHTRDQCKKYHTSFYFKQTGRLFRKDGIIYTIPRWLQMVQAQKANINLSCSGAQGSTGRVSATLAAPNRVC